MARAKEYKRCDVLGKAVTLFWEKGYEGTSMADLVQATSLNSASMYKEFKSKQGLYSAALTYYRETWLENVIKVLTEQPDLDGVKKYLRLIIEISGKPDFKGCLMINTIAEEGVVGRASIAKVEKFCVRLEALLENALRNAQKSGDVPAGKDPMALASYILCFMYGLVLYGRLEDNKKSVPDIGALILETITK